MSLRQPDDAEQGTWGGIGDLGRIIVEILPLLDILADDVLLDFIMQGGHVSFCLGNVSS